MFLSDMSRILQYCSSLSPRTSVVSSTILNQQMSYFFFLKSPYTSLKAPPVIEIKRFEHDPGTSERFWLRNFAPWFLRIGKQKLARFFFMAMRKKLKSQPFLRFFSPQRSQNWYKKRGCATFASSEKKLMVGPLFEVLTNPVSTQILRRTFPTIFHANRLQDLLLARTSRITNSR